jgi:urea-proton symporter
VCPGIFPVILTILWNRHSAVAAVSSALLGLGAGLGVWLGTAYHFSGEVTLASTDCTLLCMYRTVAAALSPLLYTILVSLIWPDNYDWQGFKQERLLIDSDTEQPEALPEQQPESQDKGVRTYTTIYSQSTATEAPEDDRLVRWTRYALFWCVATFLGH